MATGARIAAAGILSRRNAAVRSVDRDGRAVEGDVKARSSRRIPTEDYRIYHVPHGDYTYSDSDIQTSGFTAWWKEIADDPRSYQGL